MALDDNMCFEIESADLTEVLDVFEKMGGDKDWLLNSARQAVAASLHGEAVRTAVRSLNGSVISSADAPVSQDAGHAQSATGQNQDVPAPTSQNAPPSDPWASDVNDYPGEAAVARETFNGNSQAASSDPWGGGGGNTQPSHPQSSTPSNGGAVSTTTDKYNREWTVGLPDAPNCHCGQPAVRMKAKSQKSGNWYTQWKCVKGSTSDYANKCDYAEFPSKK